MGIGSEIFEIDDSVPGGVYLCQVNQDVSCGACCGLYNVAGVDPSSLKRMLKRRTDLFQATARTLGALDDFARKIKQSEAQQRPFPEFHHCPYLGLIGDGRTCVGCLLHPLAASNEGIDYRGLSHYGGMACRIYFCNTMLSLNKRYKQILRMAIDDWYVYGLVVTETALVSESLALVESRLGAPLDPDQLAGNPDLRKFLASLLALKVDWPFRPTDRNTPCHYLFKDDLYPKAAIDYAGLGTTPSELDPLLFQLRSAFESRSGLRRAEALVEERIENVITAVRTAGQVQSNK